VLSPIYELTLKVYLKSKKMMDIPQTQAGFKAKIRLRLQKQTIFSTFQIPPGKTPKVFA